MRHMKHKDVEFQLSNSSRMKKIYEEAAVDAVNRSVIHNGQPVTIYVYAWSKAGASWWDRNFTGDDSARRRFARDENKPIDKIVIRAR